MGVRLNIKMLENLKKFGLKHHDFPTMLWNVTFCIRLLSLNLDPNRKKPTGLFGYSFFFFMAGCYYYIYLVSMAWFVFWRCRETGLLLPAIIVFSLGCSSEISMTKFLFIIYHRKSVRKILAAYLACDAQVVPDSRFAANLKKTLRAVKKRAMIAWSVILWNGVVYILKPLLTPGPHFMEDVFEFIGFENMSEMTTTPIYEILFSVNCVAVYATCMPAGSVTALFIIIVGYTEAQMLALSSELINLWDDALDDYNKLSIDDGNQARHLKIERTKILNGYVRNRLVNIVSNHTTNINLLKNIDDVFHGAIAVEFMLLMAGVIAELLGGLEKTYIQLPFALMLVSTDCLTGQRVKDASMIFEKAVYDCKWENFDVNNRKIVLLMLQNSQKSMKLSAGGVAFLNLECLMSILRTIYSAYTTLRSTMK